MYELKLCPFCGGSVQSAGLRMTQQKKRMAIALNAAQK